MKKPANFMSTEYWKSKKMNCICGNIYEYVEAYDAFMCEKCDDWLEPKCIWDECLHCSNRPSKPSMIKDIK